MRLLLLLLLLLLLPLCLPFHLSPLSPLSHPPTSLFAKPKRPQIPVTTVPTEKAVAPRPPLGHVIPAKYKTIQSRAKRVSGGSGGRQMGVMEQGKQREAGINNVSRLRIQGGLYKNRQVMSPDVYLRPMMGKVKSAVFSTLRSFGLYSAEYGPVRYLDVFAGSGGVGLESLSRSDGVCEGGASDFVDFSEDCKRTIEKNLINLGINEDPNGQRVPNGVLTQTGNRGWAYLADAIGFLRTPEKFGKQVSTTRDREYDVISLTPPYEEVVYSELLEALCVSPLVGKGCVCIVEYPVELGCLPHVVRSSTERGRTLIGVRNRKYGRTVVAMYRVEGEMGRLVGCESKPEEFINL